jgi:hypothetical protein
LAVFYYLARPWRETNRLKGEPFQFIFPFEQGSQDFERRSHRPDKHVTYGPDYSSTQLKSWLIDSAVYRQLQVNIPVEIFEQSDHQRER